MSRPTQVRGTANLPSPAGVISEHEYQQFRKGDPVKVRGRSGARVFYGVTLTGKGNMWALVTRKGEFESCPVEDLLEVT